MVMNLPARVVTRKRKVINNIFPRVKCKLTFLMYMEKVHLEIEIRISGLKNLEQGI